MAYAGGKTCVITGATSGLGLETARQLAAGGLRIIGTGRGPDGCRAAEEAIRGSVPGAEVRILAADFSSLANVRAAAAAIRRKLSGGRLDRLVHAATAVSRSYIGTEDGYELQFAVNYLAAFLLTRELFPALVRPDEARVIVVSSHTHRRATIAWDDPMGRRRYDGLRAYRQSKLALILFTFELNRRVTHRFPLRALGIEPGSVDAATGPAGGGRARTGRRAPGESGLSPADAASAIVRLAADPPSWIAADYWRLGRPVEPSPYARGRETALRLWRLSERLCGAEFL